MAAAKVRQSEQANSKRREEPVLMVGDMVMIDSRNRRLRYKDTKNRRATKFFPRHDGPYSITHTWPDQSLYQLDLGIDDKSFPKFHVSLLKKYVPNDPTLFPSRTPTPPPPVIVNDELEWVVAEIIDEKLVRKKKHFRVRWEGYPKVKDSWEPERFLEETVALDRWESKRREEG